MSECKPDLEPSEVDRLLAAAQAGDEEALNALCRHFLPRMYAWATGRIPQAPRRVLETADIVQETLIKAIRNLDSFRPETPGGLEHYLRRAVKNKLRDTFRVTARMPNLTEPDGTERSPGADPHEELEQNEIHDEYEAALRRLRTADREAVVARLDLGYSYAEIAKVLEKPSAEAARKAVSRALVRLAEEMSHVR